MAADRANPGPHGPEVEQQADHLAEPFADHSVVPTYLLSRFARSLCQNFSTLQEKGHPKWKEVDLTLPALNEGWTYYPPTTREIRACLAARNQPARPAKACSAEEKILGLCAG